MNRARPGWYPVPPSSADGAPNPMADLSASFRPPTIRPLPDDAGQFRLLRTVLRNPLEAMPASAYTQPTARRRFLRRDLVYVCDPELVRQVLAEQESAFAKADAMRRALVPALGEGLLTAEGAHWRWQRRTAAPIFRHERLAGFVPAMLDAAQRARDRWLALPPGAEVDAMREMMRLTHDVIVDTMLSGAPGLDGAQVERGIADYLDSTPWAVATSLFGLPAWTPHPGKLRARRARTYLRDALLGIVARRRRQEDGEGQAPSDRGPGRPDLVRLLLEARDPETGRAMSDRELADNLLTFVVAGHETTALTLTWTLYLLARHPEAEARVVAEIERACGDGPLHAEHVPDLAYARQVIHEAMRLYPPVSLITRVARREVRLGALLIPAGTPTYVPVYALHRHAALWDDPDRFDPDRFLPDAARARHRHAYLPFGAGPRACIGASFAVLEAVAILATLLRSVRVSLRPGAEPSPRLRITLRPEGGLPIRPRPRAAAPS